MRLHFDTAATSAASSAGGNVAHDTIPVSRAQPVRESATFPRMIPMQTVLFDLDGTLIDSVRLILDSYHHTLAAHGIPARSDEEWLRGVGTPLTVQFAEWSDDLGTLEALIATYREYNLTHHDRMVTVYPGIVQTIEAIRAAGCRTGLVTSKNRQGALRGLTLVKLERMMDVLVCADEVTNPKPHPEPVEKAVALLEADPATTVYVGDSIHDMVSGRAAGVRTAAALWGPFGRSHLEGAAPDFWLEAPGDLLGLVGL
jgi:pyrophosphatase PpaX